MFHEMLNLLNVKTTPLCYVSLVTITGGGGGSGNTDQGGISEEADSSHLNKPAEPQTHHSTAPPIGDISQEGDVSLNYLIYIKRDEIFLFAVNVKYQFLQIKLLPHLNFMYYSCHFLFKSNFFINKLLITYAFITETDYTY